jgi:uncharacterized membrane protein
MNNARLLDYLYIAATVGFTVYGQLILKWRVGHYGTFPESTAQKIGFLARVLLDPWILSGLFAAFLASLAWIAAVSKFELSYAYPFMSLNFVVVFALSAWFLGEPLSLQRAAGVALIVVGTVVASRA